jgi:Ribonuclease G/E
MAGAADDLGLILRSACDGAEPDAVAEDIAAMRDLAEAVTADLDGGPELLVDGASAHDLAWRDWLDPAPDEVVEDGGFADHGLAEAIEALLAPRVDLPGGASVWIEPTRALVAVDVNTGPDTSPAASLKANVAAARDLPRQLRLRGLGGQVVIDFAPSPKRDRHILDQVIKAAFKPEGEANLSGWTPLGLYELTRRRDRLAWPILSARAGNDLPDLRQADRNGSARSARAAAPMSTWPAGWARATASRHARGRSPGRTPRASAAKAAIGRFPSGQPPCPWVSPAHPTVPR